MSELCVSLDSSLSLLIPEPHSRFSVVAWLAWGTAQIHGSWSWRTLTLLQGVPSVIQLVFLYCVSESPRWLVSKERYDEAEDILTYNYANGDRNNDNVEFQFREIRGTLRLEFEVKATSSYMDFFCTKGNRYRLALLISLGVISQYSWYALFSNYSSLNHEATGITSQNQTIPISILAFYLILFYHLFRLVPTNTFKLNGGQTILGLVVSMSSAFLIDSIDRRPLFLLSTAGMMFSFLAWTVMVAYFKRTDAELRTLGPGALDYLQTVGIWLYSVMYSLAWTGLLIALHTGDSSI